MYKLDLMCEVIRINNQLSHQKPRFYHLIFVYCYMLCLDNQRLLDAIVSGNNSVYYRRLGIWI